MAKLLKRTVVTEVFVEPVEDSDVEAEEVDENDEDEAGEEGEPAGQRRRPSSDRR